MTSETVVRLSEVAVVAVSLGLSLALVVHTVRATRDRDRKGRPWLATGSCLLLYAAMAVPGLEVLWFVAFPLLVAVYPDGRFTPRWLALAVPVSGVLAAGDAATGGAWSDRPWWQLFAMGQMVLLLAQVHRYRRRRAGTGERAAVRWVILGTLLTVAAYMLVLATYEAVGTGPTGAVVGARLAILPLLVCVGLGLLRPRAVDVDPVLHLTLVVLGTLSVLAAVVLALPAPPTARLVVAAVVAAPVALGMRRVADWVVWRGRPREEQAVARLLAALNSPDGQHDAPRAVLASVLDAAWLEGGRITGSWFAPVAQGTLRAATTFEVDYRGERLAVLDLGPRRGETELTRRDRRVVEALVRQAAPALEAARTLLALQESRARTVAAREEERRRLRRELHDDLGPTLSGIALSASALATTTGHPDAAQLHRDVRLAVEQSRDLAYGLRPPVLDDHGLVAALHDRVGGPDVRIEAPPVLALPAAVDLAALRIVQEAVLNARRHAAAQRIVVDLRLVDEVLHVTVCDDGPGLPPDVRAGIGMHAIAERAEEVGGTARYDRQAAGCRLVVALPVVVA